MSSEKQPESSDPASADAPSEAEQIEQQLSGLAETHFARKKQEIKASQEAAGSHVVGKLLNKVDGLTKGKASGRQGTTAAASENTTSHTDVAAAPILAEQAAQPVAVGQAVPVTAALDADALSATISPILARLSNVEKTLKESSTAGRKSEAQTRQAIEKLLEVVSKQEAGINSIVQFLRKQAQAQSPAPKPSESDRPRSRLIPERKPAEAVAAAPMAPVAVAAAPVASGENWHQAVFGPQLAADATTAASRQQMLNAAAAGEKNAATLAGLLLMFHAAAPERRPQMLKDIGEAFYRWRPDADSDSGGIRAALLDWLIKHSEESGKANTIELVHPGDRFDNTRHHAQQRGAEIVRVFGWLVLRESGKVYTKASVAVQ